MTTNSMLDVLLRSLVEDARQDGPTRARRRGAVFSFFQANCSLNENETSSCFSPPGTTPVGSTIRPSNGVLALHLALP